MAGFTNAFSKIVLDDELVAGDYIAWSENGTTETGLLARTAVGSWAAATTADPSIKDNAGTVTSAGSSGAGTISHYAVFSAATAGVQKTDWGALDVSRAVTLGAKLFAVTGEINVTLT